VYNQLQGGIERWFEPVLPSIVGSASLQALIRFAADAFVTRVPEVPLWRVEVHQFRIEALPDQPGQPTPEGVHRDGVDYVMVTLIDRHNILSGTTSVHSLDADHTEIAHFTLTRPLDSVLIDDHRLAHGVTAVAPQDELQPAWRDVLVVTFAKTEQPRPSA
jgi:hypothetical protein